MRDVEDEFIDEIVCLPLLPRIGFVDAAREMRASPTWSKLPPWYGNGKRGSVTKHVIRFGNGSTLRTALPVSQCKGEILCNS